MSAHLVRPHRGFVLGKFMPPHMGHVFMCDFARRYCERLTILVCSLPTESIPGSLRHAWMREMFPDCEVLWCDELLPQAPSGPGDEAFWSIWRDVVDRYAGNDCRLDVVFASEHYGRRLAEVLEAEFVPVDFTRTARSISGTAIRNDPFATWDFIPPVVRPYFTKRVCLFGPESTGKSTLAVRLAAHFQTICVPEYGRTYTETFGTNIGPPDLRKFVMGHVASVAAAKRQANRILIEDTDPVLTAVWSEMLTGVREDWLTCYNDYADLYLLTDIDLPWSDDGTRYFDDQASRSRFFQLCGDELKSRRLRYEVIRGQGELRFDAAVSAIQKEFFVGMNPGTTGANS